MDQKHAKRAGLALPQQQACAHLGHHWTLVAARLHAERRRGKQFFDDFVAKISREYRRLRQRTCFIGATVPLQSTLVEGRAAAGEPPWSYDRAAS
jgi:hypothetical protein